MSNAQRMLDYYSQFFSPPKRGDQSKWARLLKVNVNTVVTWFNQARLDSGEVCKGRHIQPTASMVELARLLWLRRLSGN